MQGGAHPHHNACGRRTDPRPSSTCAPGAQCLLILCCTLLNEGREVSSHQDMLRQKLSVLPPQRVALHTAWHLSVLRHRTPKGVLD